MRYAGLVVVLIILSVWLLGGISIAFAGPRRSIRTRVIRILAGTLMALGALSFFGHAVANSGGFNWLPNSFEWPVGKASGVVTMADGTHVVPLVHAARVQVYDRNWHFLRGWFVDGAGHGFHLSRGDAEHMNVITSRPPNLFVYTLDGVKVSNVPLKTSEETNSEAGEDVSIPTPWWLWFASSPIHGWILAAAGIVLAGLSDRKKRADAPAPPKPAVDVPAPATPIVPAPSVAVPSSMETGEFSFANYGCFGAVVVWTAGWLVILLLALSSARRSPTLSIAAGSIVSGLMLVFGCRLIVSTARSARRGGPNVTSTETLARRITGWFAAVVWCTAGVMWNIGIFAVLIRAAGKGEGWTILILLLWSLIGLFLLGILFIAIGSVIDGLWRLIQKSPSHPRPMH